MIRFQVEDANGAVQDIEVPSDISLSLMEVLKASEFNVMATCGGIALCATCHVEVKKGWEKIGDPAEAELGMIDTLPNASDQSRLACQIRINEDLNDACFVLRDDSNQ